MNRTPLDGLRTPRPSPELRERVLRAAMTAPSQAHWIDRLWSSPGWRAAAAIALAALLLANFALGGAPEPVPIPAPPPVVVDGIVVPSPAPASEPPATAAIARELDLEVVR